VELAPIHSHGESSLTAALTGRLPAFCRNPATTTDALGRPADPALRLIPLHRQPAQTWATGLRP